MKIPLMGIAAGMLEGGGHRTAVIRPGVADGQDTYISIAAPTTNFGSTDALVVRSGASARNSLLKFDLSSLAGASVVSAKLHLFSQAQVAASGTYEIHAILAANNGWLENSATWNTPDGSATWAGDVAGDAGADAGCSQSGVDYNATAMGTFSYVNGTPTETEYIIDLDATQVEAMIANNYGIIILQSSGTAGNYAWHASEASIETYRPKLVITF